jgi:hypothetical protein
MSHEEYSIVDGPEFVLFQYSSKGDAIVSGYVGIDKAMNLILLLSILIPEWKARELAPIIGDVSASYRMDPLLVSAVIYKESKFKRGLCFHGAHGLMQIQLKNKSCNVAAARAGYLYNNKTNIGRGVKMLSFWRKWCKDSNHAGHHWLLHYNQGFGKCPDGKRTCNARKRIPITTGKIGGYAMRVFRIYNLLKEANDRSPTS